MNNKILFMIVNGEAKLLSDSTMDHREWYVSLGYDQNNFDNVIRGFVMDGKIVFFKGSNFNYDNEVINSACYYGPIIRDNLNNQTLEICCGILIEAYGQKWEPVVRISDEEITKYNNIRREKQQVQKIDYSQVQTENILDFKNDYNDTKFIKNAVIVTSVVLVITLLSKIILFSRKEIMQMSNLFDLLLAVGQIGLLGFCIYGYKAKKIFTKYIGIIASVLIILTLNIIDVIVGIVYFVFSIDQGYFVKAIDMIKNMINKKK